MVIYFAIMIFQILYDWVQIKLCAKSIAFGKFIYLILELFSPLKFIIWFFSLLFTLFSLLFDLFFFLVKLDQSGWFVKANDDEADDSHKDIGFHVFWDVV